MCFFERVLYSRWRSTQSTSDFGFKDVPRNEKQGMVREVFSKVASKYDVMNDVMSMGAHRLWKDELVAMMGLKSLAKYDTTTPLRFLDVAGGTGDVGFRIHSEVQKNFVCFGDDATRKRDDQGRLGTDEFGEGDKQIVICDINPEMLVVGKKRARQFIGASGFESVGFVEGNAECLPFEGESCTVSNFMAHMHY